MSPAALVVLVLSWVGVGCVSLLAVVLTGWAVFHVVMNVRDRLNGDERMGLWLVRRVHKLERVAYDQYKWSKSVVEAIGDPEVAKRPIAAPPPNPTLDPFSDE